MRVGNVDMIPVPYTGTITGSGGGTCLPGGGGGGCSPAGIFFITTSVQGEGKVTYRQPTEAMPRCRYCDVRSIRAWGVCNQCGAPL